MSPRLEDENHDEAKYNQEQEENAFSSSGVALISVTN
jgi:hypothetical protein